MDKFVRISCSIWTDRELRAVVLAAGPDSKAGTIAETLIGGMNLGRSEEQISS